jgi:hypothetical protein
MESRPLLRKAVLIDEGGIQTLKTLVFSHWRINCWRDSMESYPTQLVLTGPFLEDTATTASVDGLGYAFEFDLMPPGEPFVGELIGDCFSTTLNGDHVEDIEDVAFGSDVGYDVPVPTYAGADLRPDAFVSFDPFQNEFTFYVGYINSGEAVFALSPQFADSYQEEFPFAIKEAPEGDCSLEGVSGPFTDPDGVSVFSFFRILAAALNSIRWGISRTVRSLYEVLCGQGC